MNVIFGGMMTNHDNHDKPLDLGVSIVHHESR